MCYCWICDTSFIQADINETDWKDVYRICTGYVQDVYRICTGYVQDVYRICTGYVQDMYRIHLIRDRTQWLAVVNTIIKNRVVQSR